MNINNFDTKPTSPCLLRSTIEYETKMKPFIKYSKIFDESIKFVKSIITVKFPFNFWNLQCDTPTTHAAAIIWIDSLNK